MQKNKNSKAWDEYITKTSIESWDVGQVVIGGENIVPYFQPIIGLTSGQIVGYECLARALNNTTNAKSSPRSFGHFFSNPKISTSYQLEVDRALRFQALEYFSKHSDAGYITLNISPH